MCGINSVPMRNPVANANGTVCTRMGSMDSCDDDDDEPPVEKLVLEECAFLLGCHTRLVVVGWSDGGVTTKELASCAVSVNGLTGLLPCSSSTCCCCCCCCWLRWASWSRKEWVIPMATALDR